MVKVNLLAEDECLLSIDPDTHQAAVLLVVVVAGGSYPGAHEPAVGQEGPDPAAERRP